MVYQCSCSLGKVLAILPEVISYALKLLHGTLLLVVHILLLLPLYVKHMDTL